VKAVTRHSYSRPVPLAHGVGQVSARIDITSTVATRVFDSRGGFSGSNYSMKTLAEIEGLKPRLHDTTCCHTGLTTGCIV